jgi:protein phosphatase 1G
MHCLAPNTSGDGTGCDNMTAIIVKFNFNQQPVKEINEESVVSKSIEHSPWPTMFTSVNKRPLSPEQTSPTETIDNNNSKKLKIVEENGNNQATSPSKTTGDFSFNTATNNINNSSDDQQL